MIRYKAIHKTLDKGMVRQKVMHKTSGKVITLEKFPSRSRAQVSKTRSLYPELPGESLKPEQKTEVADHYRKVIKCGLEK